MAKVNHESVETVREKMRQAAKACGMTQEEIGLRMGLTKGGARQAVSRLLGQSDYDPRLSTLLAFAHAIGRPLKDFVQ